MTSERPSLRLIAGAAAVSVVLPPDSRWPSRRRVEPFGHLESRPTAKARRRPWRAESSNVEFANVGGPAMMGGSVGGTMQARTSQADVPAGTVSLRVANLGSLVHELVVLPLVGGQQVGQRPVGTDGKVDESGSLGEASRTCGTGASAGIDPGAIGWVILDLRGAYEVICDLPGHYAAGMYTELQVD